jgi:glutamate-1-semialdehyde 2,1-aminomutase
MTTIDRNQQLFDRAKALIPGGVNSPCAPSKPWAARPLRAAGAGRLFLGCQWQTAHRLHRLLGPDDPGPRPPGCGGSRAKALLDGFSFGAPTEREVELAEEIVKLVPSLDMVRLVSSGTEAGMSAIRLARGATGRKKIIKFEGCYHGHADALLVKAGSGLATFGNPTSAGVPPEVVQHTLVLEYNNIEQLEAAFAEHGADVATLMIEPIAGNMNFVRASVPFMTRCRELCTQHGALLAFDEVMTGFRVGLGSAQGVYASLIPGFEPDMTVMGKVIGGGMPLAAFGGKRAVMEQLAPHGRGVPGRHAQRQPGGHRLWAGHTERNPETGLL